MNTKLFKKGLFSRLIIFLIIANFIIPANAVASFAGKSNLRPVSNRKSSRAEGLRSNLDIATLGKGLSRIDKAGSKDGGDAEQIKIQDSFRKILGDYSVSQTIDDLPYGTYIKNEIDLSKSSTAVKDNLEMNFGAFQDTDRFYTLEIKGIPLALVKKDKEGTLSVKKITDAFTAIPMKALTERPSQFTSQGLDAADVLINDFIFFEKRARVPIPERMTIEFRELLNYVYELAKEVGEKKAIEMGAALIDTTPDKLASIFRKLGREDAKAKGLELAGGKGLSLSVMAKIVAVPAGLNCTTTAYFKFVRENRQVWEKIFNELRVLDTMDDQRRDTVTEEIRTVMKEAAIPEDIKHEILAMYRQLNVLAFLSGKPTPTPVAVRSSGTKEDIHITTFLPVSTGSQAGQSDTYLNVRGESKVLEKTRADFSSLFTDRAVSYRDDATFLLWSGSIAFKDKTSQTVYFDIIAKLREYATKLSKPEYKLYADSMSKVTSPNPGSVNLMNALEDILKQEDNPEIANALKMLKEKSQEVVHPEQIGIDVVIMQMVKSHFAGVIFTVNPATKMAGVAQALYKAWYENDDSLVYRDPESKKIIGTKPIVVSFDIAFGYGENVVGGKVNPDKFIMSTYDGEKWFVLEKNKGNKLIQMIDVEEAIKYLGDEIPQDKALEIFAKVKKDALVYLQKWMKEGDIRVTTPEGDPMAYEEVVSKLEASDTMQDLKKELVVRWLGKTFGEAISYDEVGRAINGILAKDLQGIKYLQPDPKKPDEIDKDKKERLQKLANDIADKVKNKESEAEVIKFIKDNFYVVSQKGEKGIQESILSQVVDKIFAKVKEAAKETDRGMHNLAAVLGDLQKADSLRWTVKEIWENKEYRKPQERLEVLSLLGLRADKQKNLSYLLRSLIDNSLTANYETTILHQNEFTITDQIAERICRMAWSIANFYKDKRDIEFAIEVDPTVSDEERIELFLRDKFGKLWGTDENGKAVMVTEANMATAKKASMKLYNVQARPYTAEYLKVDVVRARTEVDEKYLEEKNPKPIASGTKGENASHAFVIVYDSNKGVPWHADLIRRLKSGVFTDEEKEMIRKGGFNPDDFGEGKDQRLPIALNLLEADPNHDPIMRLVDAVITTRGGDTCHAAIFCREQGIPAVTGTGKVILKDRLIQTGDFLTVDANNGKIYEMDVDPAKRIPIIFVKFKIKPYAIPGDDDGMEFPKIGQIIAATSAAQQNSPIMLAVDADGNSLTRAEFEGEKVGLNVFAGYGYDLINDIKSGRVQKPQRIRVKDLFLSKKSEVSEAFRKQINDLIYRDFSNNPANLTIYFDAFRKDYSPEDGLGLLVGFDIIKDIASGTLPKDALTENQRAHLKLLEKLPAKTRDVLTYAYGLMQRRYNYDYNIVADMEAHPWILDEIKKKLDEQGYTSFKEFVQKDFVYFYNLMGFTIAAKQTAKNRAYDFAQDKIRGMPGSEVFAWAGVNPLVGLRGSALEIEAVNLEDNLDGNQKILDFLFDAVIEAHENTHNQGWFYVFVRFPREVEILDKIIERKGQQRGKLPKQIGIMIEVPSDAIYAEKLAEKLDSMKKKYKKYGVEYTFFSFGTNDYSHLAGKGDREDPRMKLDILDPAAKAAIADMKQAGYYYDDASKKLPLIDEGADVMLQLMEAVVKGADKFKVVTSLCGEAITALINRGAYEIAGRIMALLKSFGVSMMKVRLGASMTRVDVMAAMKEIIAPADKRKVLLDLSNAEVRQKSGIIKGEVIYIEKAEDLLPEGLKSLRGEELKKKREELKLQSLAVARSTVRTYDKIVVISRNFASQQKNDLVALLGQDLFAGLIKEGMLKEIGKDSYIWTNLDLDAEKLNKELAKLGLSEAEIKTAAVTWKTAWDNSIDGLERLGIDWDDLQYAKAIIVDADVNLEGWNVFRKDKSLNFMRIKAVVKGIAALRNQLEGKFVTIDYGAKKIYEENLQVKRKEVILRSLPIPESKPKVPTKSAVRDDANRVYDTMGYHPLILLAYQRNELDDLGKLFDEYVTKLSEEVDKVTKESNPLKKQWLLKNLEEKINELPEPVIKEFMKELIAKAAQGKTDILKDIRIDDLRTKYFRDLKDGIRKLLGSKTAEEFITDAFKSAMLQTITANSGALVIHELTSLNCIEFSKKRGGFLKEQINPNPDYGLLGAARALSDMWEINRMELNAFKQVRDSLSAAERKNFGLQITNVRGTQAGAVVIGWKYILKDMNIIPGQDGLEIGVNIETPANTLGLDTYFDYFKDLGSGLSFITYDKMMLGAAWSGVDIYWDEWRRLAREEELLELGEISSWIAEGKIEAANKADQNNPKAVVVFENRGAGDVIDINRVPPMPAAVMTTPSVTFDMTPQPVPYSLVDGGIATTLINFAAENFIVGDEAKGQDVGRSIRLAKLLEKTLFALLGHSATRQAFVNENAKNIEPALSIAAKQMADSLVAGGMDRDRAIIEALNIISKRYSPELKVEPYVIAAAKEMAMKLIGEQKASPYAANFDSLVKFQAREIAAARFDQILNHRIHALLSKGTKIISLCVGSETKNLPIENEKQAIRRQLVIDFTDISAKQLTDNSFFVAFEPSGLIGANKALETDYIRDVHQDMYDWFVEKYGAETVKAIWGKSLKILYGASVDGKNVDAIMAVKSQRADMAGVPLVHGVLFASSGKKVEGFLAVAQGVDRAARRDGLQYVCFVNLKQFTDKDPVEKYVAGIYKAVNDGNINVADTLLFITDQEVELDRWQTVVAKIESSSVKSGAGLEKVINDLSKNTGLPFKMPSVTFPGSGYDFWSQALKVLYFDRPVYRRVEREPDKATGKDKDGNTPERISGILAFSGVGADTDIGELREYDIEKYAGGTRTVADMKEVLRDESAAKSDHIAYYMHRGVFASKEDIGLAFYGANKLRYDITVIPPADWGQEPAKTMGHYHDPVDFPEIYQVVSGEVLWLQQKTDQNGKVIDFVYSRAKTGDIVIMLPGYGHVSVNLSSSEPLVMANWLTWHQSSQYGSFKTQRGAAFHVIRSNGQLVLVANKQYQETRTLKEGETIRQMAPKDAIPEFGLKRGEPIYNLVKDPAFLSKTRFLYHPEEYKEPLTPEASLDKNVNPNDRIKIKIDGGTVSIPAFNTLAKSELEGLRVLLRLDLNVSDESGKIKSEKRIKEAMPTIQYYIDNGATVIITSHNGRPKGKVKPDLTLGPNEKTKDGISLRIEKFLRQAGYNTEVVFHPNSITDKGVKPGLRHEIKEGAVNVIENVRFAKGEEKNYKSFYKDVAGLADFEHFDFDAFGAGERPDAVSSAKYMQSISQGLLMEKEDKYLKDALKVIYGLVVGGGPKISEKLPVIKNVIENKKEPGGFTIWGTAPTTFFLDVLYGIKLGDSKYTDEKRVKSRQDNIELVKEIIEISRKAQMENIIGVDFIAVDRDLTEIAEGEDSWIALKKIPEGAKVYKVSLEQLRAGKFLDENNKEVLVSNLFLYDIGDKTKELFKSKIMATPKGRSVFYNGTIGVFEMPMFASGGKAVDEALAEIAQSERISVIGGGDTGKEAEKNKVDKLVTHLSTGGGASAAVLKGEVLSAIKELQKTKVAVDKKMETLGSDVGDFMRFLVAGKKVFKARGGELFDNFISQAAKAQGIKEGDLSKLEINAETKEDSRKQPTVRVTLKIGDLETIGDVPAGASKGEFEAVTLPIEQAVANVAKITKILQESGLNLSRHDDLRQAERLIIKAAGENFKDLGANAVVPVSWALWRMAAKLHDMELWQYIRWYEPGVIGSDNTYFYMNIFNGGLHARKDKDKEILGIHRIPFQEIMIIPKTAVYNEALEWGDRIQLALRSLLIEKYGEEKVSIADEAGFSVLGLGDTLEASRLVCQAVQNAGLMLGQDVWIGYDVASNSFYKDGKYYLGKDSSGKSIILDAEEFLAYELNIIDTLNSEFATSKNPNIVVSVEDGTAEGDRLSQAKLTAELKKRGILAIGDDWFVTQQAKLQEGIDNKAGNAILIKVNQNGTVSGTLDTIRIAKDNGFKWVVSHRSGETLDDGIADLAYATGAFGLKTGAPQPAELFKDETKLVRRAKYLRMIAIQAAKNIRGKALLVEDNFLRLDGARNVLSRLDELSDTIKVVLFGENAQKIKLLIGNDNVIVAKDKSSADAYLDKLGIETKTEIGNAGLSTVEAAKAVNRLMQSRAVDALLADFSSSMQAVATAQISEEVRKAQETVEEFVDKV